MTRAKIASAQPGWLSLPNLWLAGCLTLTALACAALAAMPGGKPSKALHATAVTAAGETTIAPVDERIELAQVGTAVWSHNPSGEEDLSLGDQVDPATWKHLVLRAPKADGSHCEINLLRPDWWVELEAAETGGEVYVSVPECGIDGDAQVLAIHPCPPIQPTPPGYRTITGTFHHHNARVLDLHVSGLAEPIGVTANHPFWSADRQEFVRADELKPGERLSGLAGNPVVRSTVHQSGLHAVFNLEVAGSHAFCVSNSGLIVHNSCSNIKSTVRKGKLGETLAGIPKVPKHSVKSLTGTATRRIPDFVDETLVWEVKNRAEVKLTNQIKDFILHAKDKNKTFRLQTRKTAKIAPEIASFAKKHGVVLDLVKGLK